MGTLPLLTYCFYFFLKWNNVIPLKIKVIIRNSNLIKRNLQNIATYEREGIK